MLREPLAGTTVQTCPGIPGHLRAWFSQVKRMKPALRAGLYCGLVSPYKRGVTGSNPVAPTKYLQLDGLFETLIGGPVTTAGNHRTCSTTREACPAAVAASCDHQGTPRRRQAPVGTGTAGGLQDPRRPTWLMHTCIVVSPVVAGVRPEQAGRWLGGGRRTGHLSAR